MPNVKLVFFRTKSREKMTKVCRLCLVQLQRGSKYFNVNAVDTYSGFMPYRDQLQLCIPEMALDLIPNPVICNVCRQTLRMAYDFKNKCMAVEERIRNHVANQPLGDEYDLSALASRKIDNSVAGVHKAEMLRQELQQQNNTTIECKPPKNTIINDTMYVPGGPQTSTQFPPVIMPPKVPNILEHLIAGKQRDNYKCNFCNQCFRTLQMLRQHNSQCKSKASPPAVKTILTKRPHLPNRAKNHLKRWLFKHTEHPYPTDQEKQQLMKETDLTLLQVENWFINARRRILQDLTKLKAQCFSGTLEHPMDLDSELDLDDIYSLEKGNGFFTPPKQNIIEHINLMEVKKEIEDKEEEEIEEILEMEKPDVIIKEEVEDGTEN